MKGPVPESWESNKIYTVYDVVARHCRRQSATEDDSTGGLGCLSEKQGGLHSVINYTSTAGDSRAH